MGEPWVKYEYFAQTFLETSRLFGPGRERELKDRIQIANCANPSALTYENNDKVSFRLKLCFHKCLNCILRFKSNTYCMS